MDPTKAAPKKPKVNGEETWQCGHLKTGPVWVAANPTLLAPGGPGIEIMQCEGLKEDGTQCGKIVSMRLIAPRVEKSSESGLILPGDFGPMGA